MEDKSGSYYENAKDHVEVWGSFDIRNLGNNTVMLLFDNEDDPKRILMQGPWSFDKYIVGLFHLGEAAIVEDTRFDTTSFWVQICGL